MDNERADPAEGPGGGGAAARGAQGIPAILLAGARLLWLIGAR